MTPDDDTRPIALLLFNNHDDNGGFDEYPLIDDFVDKGFRVIYQEIAHESEYFHYLDMYTHAGERPAHTLVIGGHGTQTSLTLGEENESDDAMSFRLDTNDFIECADKSPIESGGQVFVYACSNARGKELSENLANSVASSFPEDITVYGQPVTGNLHNFHINDDLSLEMDFWVSKDDVSNVGHDPYLVAEPYVIRKGLGKNAR